MTDRLRELLDPKPTEDEIDANGEPFRADGYAPKRVALVRQTLQEAAKLVCPYCHRSVRLMEMTEGNTAYTHTYDDTNDTKLSCWAASIHTLLASTGEPK